MTGVISMLWVLDVLNLSSLSESYVSAADRLGSLNEMSAMEWPETYSVVSSTNGTLVDAWEGCCQTIK